ncbi:GHKL domain-containing protein [Ruminococcaceae bacterium OttesenSCG-928-A16]|nr:GHKL domain-containing protein [Ruminococcaceae bacterium OttesenSCG-928-A16]
MGDYLRVKRMPFKRWKRVALVAFAVVALFVLLFYYFYAYSHPYLQKNMVNISDNWHYYLQDNPEVKTMPELARIDNKANNTMIMYRELTEDVPGATLMVKSHHQTLRLLLNGTPIYQDELHQGQKKPGMCLHFVPLPAGYVGQTLTVEITSPYNVFAGFPQKIYLGDMVSLESYALSTSVLNASYLFICLALGITLIVLCLASNFLRANRWGLLFLGIFCILWGISYVSNDYSVYHFFTPTQLSNITLGTQITYFFPLMLYLYSQAQFTKKAMRPLVAVAGLSAVGGLLLHILDIADLPDIMVYTTILEQVVFSVTLVLAAYSIFVRKRKLYLYEALWIPNLIFWVLLVVSYYTNWLPLYLVNAIYLQTLFVLIIAICIVSIYGFYKMYLRRGNEIDLLESKNQMALESYETLKDNLEQTSILRHEMNHQLLALNAMLELKEYTKAEEYISTLTAQSKRLQGPIYTENYIINSILVSKLAHLPEDTIKITTHIMVPKQLNIQENDLCSLLLNLIDNALEACRKVQPPRQQWMNLSIRLRGTYLYIKESNAKTGVIITSDNRIKTSKQDKKIHGYGIRIIQSIVDKYDGMMHIDYNEEQFTVQAALKNIPPGTGKP